MIRIGFLVSLLAVQQGLCVGGSFPIAPSPDPGRHTPAEAVAGARRAIADIRPDLALQYLEAVRTIGRLGVSPSVWTEIHLLGGHALYQAGRNGEALETLFQARDLARQSENRPAEAEANLKIGNMFHFCFGEMDRAGRHYREARDMFSALGDTEGLIGSLNAMASLAMDLGRWDEASASLHEAMGLHLAAGGPRIRTATLFCNLSDIHQAIGQPDEAYRLLTQARILYGIDRYGFGLARVAGKLGAWYEADKQFPKAEAAFRQAVALRRLSGQRDAVSFDLHRLGEFLLDRGRLVEANRCFREALTIREEIGHIPGMIQSRLGLAGVLAERGHARRAARLLEATLTLCPEGQLPRERATILLELAELHSRLGRAEAALQARAEYDGLMAALRNPGIPARAMATILNYERMRAEELAERRHARRWRLTVAGIIGLLLLGAAALLAVRITRRRTDRPRGRLSGEQTTADVQTDTLTQPLSPTSSAPPSLPPEAAPVKYRSSRLSEDTARRLSFRLERLLVHDRLYLDPDLNLHTLAKRLKVNSSYLSQAVNTRFGTGLTSLLNRLRVEEACRRLHDPEHSQASVLEIGLGVGFNSKSSFNRAFKQHTGVTPGEYRQRPVAEETAGDGQSPVPGPEGQG